MASRLPTHIIREGLTKPWVMLRVFQNEGLPSRLPEHYKKFYWDWKFAPKTPVHYIPKQGKFEKLSCGTILPVQDIPIPLLQPKQLHQGIWGGEAVIKGFIKRKPTARRVPHYWVPVLQNSVVYSEILDRYMKITVTERTLTLIDKHYGFDNYILQTSSADLMSELALQLKREMLLTLCRGTLYPDDPIKREEIIEKYRQYMIPEEEADWFGLSLKEAVTKQKILENVIDAPKPLKHAFRAEFIEHLKARQENRELQAESSEDRNWLSRVNPFAKK